MTVARKLMLLVAALVASAPAATPRIEYRAFWVDTFNSTLNNHADIVALVKNVKAAGANAIIAQVRRRGDAWYLDSLEPAPDFIDIAPGFDPLLDLLTEAHAAGLEVHAWAIASAVWNKNPTFAPTATLGPPTDPRHVFNQHGGYDPATKTIVPGPDNWLTRTLLPDSGSAISFQGHRFGNDFWIDFGHPDAAAYTVDVLMRLVRQYPIDGLHLDRIRYPDFTASGQTPSNGANIGYNPVSVARFQRHYGIAPGTAPPAPGDAKWAQWRRDQVTNVVRRIYLNAVAIRPQIKVSASLIAYGGGPTTEAAWNSAEAYWRVYQDWRAWTEEGIVDIAIPMNYKREHTASEVAMFDQWVEWTRTHQYQRTAMVGLGSYLNAVEGSLKQARRVLAATPTGVTFYSMANTNVAVGTTPLRPFPDFAAALTTGKSADGSVSFEASDLAPLFGDLGVLPLLSWKVAPRNGHLMGVVHDADTMTVEIRNLETGAVRTAVTDGGGFYGAVDLAPGRYRIHAAACAVTATVSPGYVTTADIDQSDCFRRPHR